MMVDQISDMVTRIRNGQRIGLYKIDLYTPSSRVCINILNVLYKEGFIRGFKIKSNNPLKVEILLKYDAFGNPAIKQITRISRPSKRVYTNIKMLWNVKAGLGIFILTTPKGIMTHFDAKILNYGGEILCSVY
jgi:small subunit ribosomal protein S8